MADKRRVRRVRKRTIDPSSIENCQRTVRLEVRAFERFLRQLRRAVGFASSAMFVRLVNDREMLRLNRTFRNKPETTDVLSFPSQEHRRPARLPAHAASLQGKFLGDIAISPAVARRNAKSFGRTLEQEICILILHGFLHLLGYDHEADRGEMERVELKLRRRLGLA